MAPITSHNNAIKLRPNGFEKNSALKAALFFPNTLQYAPFFPKSLTASPRHQRTGFLFFYAFKIIGKALGILAGNLKGASRLRDEQGCCE